MQLKALLSASLILAAGTALADQPQRIAAVGDVPANLMPRHSIVPKRPILRRPAVGEARLALKFVDGARVRIDGKNGLISLAGADLGPVRAIAEQFGLGFEPMFHLPAEVIETVERRAMIASGRQQPDLQGFVFVTGSQAQVDAAANALHALDIVEFGEYILREVEHGPGPGSVAADPRTLAAAQLTARMTRMLAPTPNFSHLQKHRLGLFVDLNNNGNIEIFGPDMTPFTDDDEFYGGFEVDFVWDTAQFMIDQGLTRNWNRNKNGGMGDSVRVGVVEFGADVGDISQAHEELRHVILEPQQVMLPHRLVSRDHGTATTGIISARDHGLPGPDRVVPGDDAEVGTIGMVPRAQTWFFPTVSVTQPGGRLQTAMLSAISYMDRGDVLNFSIGFPGQGPLQSSEAHAIILAVGGDLGITSVQSAGNDCLDLDEAAFWPTFETGGIVVGAGMPYFQVFGFLFFPYFRLGFSNHHLSQNTPHVSDRVNVQAWGERVVTTGYGDLQFIPNNRRRSYTASFGGTSSAAPMIAATAAAIQGVARMFYGVPLSPAQVRGIICGGGICQEGICAPNETLISGTADPPEGDPCNPLTYDPEEDSELIGSFPVWSGDDGMFRAILTSPFFDGGERILLARVLRGKRIYGNEIAIRAADGNALVVESRFGEGGTTQNSPPFPAPTYFFSGQMTDVGVQALVGDPQAVNSFAISTTLRTNSGGFVMHGLEAWNVVHERWDWLGQVQLGQAYTTSQFAATSQYLNRSTGELLLRAWTLQIGIGDTYWADYDSVLINSSTGGLGGGGGL
ncbi:MAG: S8 family serine peptidase [Phycisphaerales bacterium]|nr:S8 family serine peptidase [Phycisphaerales bacterium]